MQQNETTMYYIYMYILQMQSMTCVYWHKPCARDFKSKRLTFKQFNQMGKHNANIVFRPFLDLNSDAIFMGLWNFINGTTILNWDALGS